MAKTDKADAKPKEKEPAKEPAKEKPAEGAADAPAKAGLPIKAIIVAVALLVVQGGGMFAILSMSGGPKESKGAEVVAPEDGEEHAGGDHAADAKKDDGHGKADAKKDDGKKDDGHGKADAKKDGGKKDDGHGKGASPADADPDRTSEALVVKDKFPNGQTGRTWLWDVEVHVQVRNRHSERVSDTLTSRSAEIRTGIARIWRTAQHSYFNEPGLETLTRQVREFLDDILGATADGGSFVEQVLISRCVGFPTDF